MNYMVCIPSPDMVSRENCEKVHNILARMSDAYKLNIVPEPVKVKQAPRITESTGSIRRSVKGMEMGKPTFSRKRRT